MPMPSISTPALAALALVALSAPARAVDVPLIVQPATYPGSVDGSTLGWAQDPLTVGIPFAQGMISDVGQLGITGANAYQFRRLGVWPDGSVKWALLDTVVDGPGSAL